MGKLSFTLTSLIAAVPAAGLCYLLVMAFLGNFEQMGTTLQAVAGLSLLGAALIALMPLGILIFFRGPDTPAAGGKAAGDDVETFDNDADFADDADGDSMGEIDAIADELDDGEFEDDDFESGELSVDDLDESDFDDDDELSGDIETSATLADDDDILDQDDMFVEGESSEFGEFNDELLDDDDEFTLAEDDDDKQPLPPGLSAPATTEDGPVPTEPASLCVFCGSRPGNAPEYRQQAEALGRELAAREIRLVFGGGSVGLMGAVCDAVLQAGGQVTGVLPEFLATRELRHFGVSDMRVVRDMHARKALMAELSDGFLALPGGYGTFEELFEIITWAQLGLHGCPIGLLNTSHFFDPLVAMIDRAVEEGFVRPAQRELILVDDEPARLLDRLAEHDPPPQRRWLNPEQT